MRHRRPARPALPHLLTLPAIALSALVLAACGGGPDPAAAAGPTDVALTPGPSPSASATPVIYTGQQVSLTNADNGTHVAADVGTDLLVRVFVPLVDDCQGAHACVVWRVDDSEGVLLRDQELTTCDKDACTAQREAFLERAGTAMLSLVAVQQCSAPASSRCQTEPVTTLWSAHVTVGRSG